MGSSHATRSHTSSEITVDLQSPTHRGLSLGVSNHDQLLDCGLGQHPTQVDRHDLEEIIQTGLKHLGERQIQAVDRFSVDAKAVSPPPFIDTLMEGFLNIALNMAVGAVAGSFSTLLMSVMTPALKASLPNAGTTTIAVVGKLIEDATKDGIKASAKEAFNRIELETPPFFILEDMQTEMSAAIENAWYDGVIEFILQSNGLSNEDICSLRAALNSTVFQQAYDIQYAAMAGAWANYLGRASAHVPSVGATANHLSIRLTPEDGKEFNDSAALELAKKEGGIPEMGFDPQLMLHVHVELDAPGHAQVVSCQWPGMSPLVRMKMSNSTGIAIKQLHTPLRVSTSNGAQFDVDPSGAIYRNISRGAGRAILNAMGSGHNTVLPENFSVIPGQSEDDAMVDAGALLLVQKTIWPNTYFENTL